MLNIPKIKVPASELECGMYVHELDRPWLGSPFLFQGFILDSEEVLKQVQGYSQHVFVDPLRSTEAVQEKLRRFAAAIPVTKPKENIWNGTGELSEAEFAEALKRAKLTYNRTRDYIDLALEDVRMGNSVDTAMARELVTDMVGNIIHSPSASVWLTYLKNRDEYTAIHCVNVCILALTFARHLKLTRDEMMIIGMGALLHDLGKMKVPDHILNKPGKLTHEEFDVIKLHPMHGYEMLRDKDDLDDPTLNIVLHHHERMNGQGYPNGLEDQDIPRLTKMVSIVDVYDAITSDRCYHVGVSPYDALNAMYSWIEGNFEKEMIEDFIKCLGIYPMGSLVELTLGQVGVVISTSEKSRLKPVIMLVLDNEKKFYKQRKLINLANPRWSTGAQALQIKRILPPNTYGIDVRRIIAEETGGI